MSMPTRLYPWHWGEEMDWRALADGVGPCDDGPKPGPALDEFDEDVVLVCDEFYVCEAHRKGRKALARLKDKRRRSLEPRR